MSYSFKPDRTALERLRLIQRGRALILRVLVVIVGALGLACSHQAIKSTCSAGRIEVDGSPFDWGGIPPNYITAPNIEYRTANDSTNLFVLLRSPDRTLPITVAMHGLRIWIDPKAAKQKKSGIGIEGSSVHIPTRMLTKKESLGEHHIDETSQRITRGYQVEISTVLDSLVNAAFLIESSGKISVAKEKGVLVSSGKQEEWFVLEMKLPFDTFGIEFPQDKNPVISLGIEIPAAQPPNLKNIPRPDEEDYPQPQTSPPQPPGRMPFERRFFKGLDVWLRIELETLDPEQTSQHTETSN